MQIFLRKNTIRNDTFSWDVNWRILKWKNEWYIFFWNGWRWIVWLVKWQKQSTCHDQLNKQTISNKSAWKHKENICLKIFANQKKIFANQNRKEFRLKMVRASSNDLKWYYTEHCLPLNFGKMLSSGCLQKVKSGWQHHCVRQSWKVKIYSSVGLELTVAEDESPEVPSVSEQVACLGGMWMWMWDC